MSNMVQKLRVLGMLQKLDFRTKTNFHDISLCFPLYYPGAPPSVGRGAMAPSIKLVAPYPLEFQAFASCTFLISPNYVGLVKP